MNICRRRFAHGNLPQLFAYELMPEKFIDGDLVLFVLQMASLNFLLTVRVGVGSGLNSSSLK